MGQGIVQVDAFTDRPFAGNPAGVCVLAVPAGERWMQDVAREMNLSETAFLTPLADPEAGGRTGPPGNLFHLRWFTPALEVDLCGHATLASAHVLWEEGRLRPDEEALFQTRSGLLRAWREGDWIMLDFPAAPPEPVETPPGAVEAVGPAGPVRVVWAGRKRTDLLLHLAPADGGDAEETIRGLRPDFGALARLDARGVIVTGQAPPGRGYDYVTRFFAPRVGINEDPVTGSAQCGLGPYWAGRLGKNELVGRQVSSRGGLLRVRVGAATLGAPGAPGALPGPGDRVHIGGKAITVLRGELI